MSSKLKVGIVGGGSGSFMGSVHRSAIEQSGRAELVCGAFGSTRQSSFETGKQFGLPTKRSYGTYRDMFRREAALPAGERMDFVAILAPNTMHYPVAMSSIDAGFPVLSEKPFTCNVDEALNLSRKQRDSGLAYGITMTYQNYPMLQKARELAVEEKALGTIRKVVANYPLGWLAQRLENTGHKQAGWRTDPRRCGPAGCLTDLGIHCFYAAEWVSGLSVSRVCADMRPTVAGRVLDDDCNILVRFDSGAHGLFMASQIATGQNSGLSIELTGDKGALAWSQGTPDRLTVRNGDGTEQVFTGGVPAGNAAAAPAPFGSDTAYVAALAATYSAFVDCLEAAGAKSAPGFMTIEEGLRAVVFVDAVLKNTAPAEADAPAPDKWTELVVPPIPEL